MRYINRVLTGMAIAAAMSTAARSQSKSLIFEVGVIKPTASTSGGVTGGCRGIDSHYGANDPRSSVPLGRCVITAGRLSHMMGIAFNIPLRYIEGFPDWDGPSRFDLEAKATEPSTTTEQELLSMLQQFLIDKFKLTMRHETKQGDIFLLAVSKDGPKHLVSSDSGESLVPTASEFVFSGYTMARFAELLTTMPTIAKPVRDTTGLQGRYDFKLSFLDRAEGDGFSKEALGRWDTIFDDLPQQLGLRLEASKGPIDSIVITHAELPAAN